jgi:hypothetical protein
VDAAESLHLLIRRLGQLKGVEHSPFLVSGVHTLNGGGGLHYDSSGANLFAELVQ